MDHYRLPANPNVCACGEDYTAEHLHKRAAALKDRELELYERLEELFREIIEVVDPNSAMMSSFLRHIKDTENVERAVEAGTWLVRYMQYDDDFEV